MNPAVQESIKNGSEYFLRQTGDAPHAMQMTLGALARVRDIQATSLAYFDVFWVSAMTAFVIVVLVLLMRRSVAGKGAHIAAE